MTSGGPDTKERTENEETVAETRLESVVVVAVVVPFVSVSIVGRLVAASCVCYHETFFWVKVMCSFTWMERCEIERCAVREKGPRMRTSCIYILPQISVHEGLQR
jgi:hypothetical protein